MLTIQPYTSEYQQQVIELILAIQQEFGIAITLADQPDLLEIPQIYQSGKGNFWLAIAQKQVVGTIALIDLGNGQAVIRKMFVQANYRKQQIGQTLLKTLLNWSSQQGFKQLYLGTTEQFKAAHRFYEKNGFVQITPVELPTAFPLIAVDTRFYRYCLSE
jgi:GNAT superfamily N-acetyltransferase